MNNRLDLIKNRYINPNEFLWKRFTPSIFIKLHFFKIFNLIYSDFSKYFSIKNIIFEQNKFRIVLKHNLSEDCFELNIRDNSIDKCDWIYCTNNICLWYHNLISNKDLLKFLLYFSKKWIFLKFNFFLEILAKDPKAKKEYYQIFWKWNRPKFSIIQDWGHELHNFKFIFPEWIFRNLDQSLKLNISEWYIHHSERECISIGPDIPDFKQTYFFSYPNWFYNHTFDKYFYLSNEEKQDLIKKNTSSFSVFTDLSEDDIIMWKWNEKLSKSLDIAIKNIKNNDVKTLIFNCCCVPRIVGDDILSLLNKAKEKLQIPFIFNGQLEKTHFEQKIFLIEKYLEKIDKSNIKKIKKSISLFWYNENIYLEKLNNILKNNWIILNSIFIPTIDIELLPKLYETELFVFSQNKLQEEIFEYPFKNLWIDFISPIYPYSLKNTDKWLNEIFSFFNKKYTPTEYEKNIIKEYNLKINYIKEKWYKISFIFIWKEELLNFINTNYNNIDVIWFLEEMWFQIDFIFYTNLSKYFIVNNEIKYTNDDIDKYQITSLINNKVLDKEKISINFVSNEEELFEIISKSNLVYSDLNFENRTYNLWINIFNIKAFKEWYDWALDTINYMIKLIEINYYKNFWKYFSK